MTDPYARYARLKFDRPHPKVLRITMENGRMNTTDAALHAELGDIWRDVDRDASVNAVILTGAGKVFSAGGDFAIIQENIDDFASRARQWKEARHRVQRDQLQQAGGQRDAWSCSWRGSRLRSARRCIDCDQGLPHH
jgi:enoyl-CoA hydratase